MSARKHATMYCCLCSFTILLLIGLLFPSGSVFAQGTLSNSHRTLAIQSGFTPLNEVSPLNANIAPTTPTGNLLQDGSFEAYSSATRDNPYWTESDSAFGTPLCNGEDCGYWNESYPYSGDAWGWFGWFGSGSIPTHTASVSQAVTLPVCTSATLQFYFWIGYAGTGSGTNDVFAAKIDGVTLFTANAAQKNSYSSYTLISRDVTSFANGAAHTIEFSDSISGQPVTFNLDDVSLVGNCGPTITGNVGVGGATLSYTDGTAKYVTSQPNGDYSLAVSDNWSGMVTPIHPCYLFNPVYSNYSNVTTNQMGQNYTPTFHPTAACKVTTGVFRPTNGALYLKNSNASGFADVQINYGLAGDYPVVGDWDGDGDATIGIYRNGSFYLRNSNTIGFADIVFAYGAPGDQPVAGDWNNDGIDTIGVYRNGVFYLRNSNTMGMPELSFALGVPGDVGIAGDWDGNGSDTTGVFRPSNGALYLKNSNATGFADIQINYGLPGDKPVTGDWDGNGTDTIGIYRNGSFYLRNANTIGFADIVFALGIAGDMPIAGNWDGLPQ